MLLYFIPSAPFLVLKSLFCKMLFGIFPPKTFAVLSASFCVHLVITNVYKRRMIMLEFDRWRRGGEDVTRLREAGVGLLLASAALPPLLQQRSFYLPFLIPFSTSFKNCFLCKFLLQVRGGGYCPGRACGERGNAPTCPPPGDSPLGLFLPTCVQPPVYSQLTVLLLGIVPWESPIHPEPPLLRTIISGWPPWSPTCLFNVPTQESVFSEQVSYNNTKANTLG